MKNNNFYKNRKMLVTGGVGSIGNVIVKRLLNYNPKVISVFDNNETGLFDLENELNSQNLRFLIGDIRDIKRLERAMEGIDIVFHAAALKHVPLCEYNPFEAVKTNVIGTQNVIDACLVNEVEKMINISTDKTVSPVNVMGATKLLTERLTTAANSYVGKRKTVFSSVRFGNVLNSRGSIVPVLNQQIKQGGPITITNSSMKRFVMSIPKAVNLVLKAAEIAKGGEIFIFKMPVLKIGDLAEVMIEELAPKYGYNPKEIRIKIIGERVGEKFCEELIAEKEVKNAYETQDMFIILPQAKEKNNFKKYSLKGTFSSEKEPLLNKKEIKKLLREVLPSFKKSS